MKINNEKMSKSLGNFFTVREIGEKYDLQVIRFFMLSAHYRSPLNFSSELVESSKNGLDRIRTSASKVEEAINNSTVADMTEAETKLAEEIPAFVKRYEDAMEDDLNTADAIAAVFDIVYASNTALSNENKNAKAVVEKTLDLIHELGGVLGLFQKTQEKSIDAEVEELIEKRNKARSEKNWAEADAIRDKLKAMNIELKDTPMV